MGISDNRGLGFSPDFLCLHWLMENLVTQGSHHNADKSFYMWQCTMIFCAVVCISAVHWYVFTVLNHALVPEKLAQVFPLTSRSSGFHSIILSTIKSYKTVSNLCSYEKKLESDSIPAGSRTWKVMCYSANQLYIVLLLIASVTDLDAFQDCFDSSYNIHWCFPKAPEFMPINMAKTSLSLCWKILKKKNTHREKNNNSTNKWASSLTTFYELWHLGNLAFWHGEETGWLMMNHFSGIPRRSWL